MSSTNKTPYFELPQFVGTDIPTWLGDFNGAMSDIDTALKTNADRADLASTQAGQAVNTANAANDAVSALQTSVAGIEGRVTACENTNSSQSTQISQNASDIDNLDGRVTSLEQSGGGVSNYGFTLLDAGSYSGNVSNFNANASLTVAGALENLDDYRIAGVIVEITLGNAKGTCFIPRPDNGSIKNIINGTVELVNRMASSSTPRRYTVNFQLSSVSGTQRFVQHISCLTEIITCGSGSTGSATITAEYNTNGITATSATIEFKCRAVVMDIV